MATAVLAQSSFTLTDRLKIQSQRIREKDYIVLGRLTAVLFEAQRSTAGLSQSRPRYTNSNQQPHLVPDAMKPFSEKQNVLWQSTTLDWLDGKRGPLLARSRDHKDLLLPEGLTPLPDIPDPRFVPAHAVSVCATNGCSQCIPKRIPQLFTGCPVVGDRVRDKLTERNGRVWGILHPVTVLSFVAFGPDGLGHFARIRGGVDMADGTHLALMIDEHSNNAYFVGGTFS